jgi:uncharacterized protein (UPF0335 family)
MAKKAESPGVGHNSIPKDKLKNIVERIERLNETVADLKSDVKEIYTEAKSAGFDVKALRGLIAQRAKDQADLAEYLAQLDLYRRALGMEALDL